MTYAPGQSDFFGYPDDPLIGLHVQLDHSCCHGDVVEIGPGVGPHGHSLICPVCHKHCGWLPKAAADFIAESIRLFGVPREPVILTGPRRG